MWLQPNVTRSGSQRAALQVIRTKPRSSGREPGQLRSEHAGGYASCTKSASSATPPLQPTCVFRGGADVSTAAAACKALLLLLIPSHSTALRALPPPAALRLAAVPAVVAVQQVQHFLGCLLLPKFILTGAS